MTASILDLLAKEAILESDMQALLQSYCSKWQVSAYQALLETHVMTEAELADRLSQAFKMDRIYEIESHDSFLQAKSTFDYAKAIRFEAYPRKLSDGVLELVICDPTTTEAQNRFADLTSSKVRLVVAERSEILAAIERDFPMQEQLGLV